MVKKFNQEFRVGQGGILEVSADKVLPTDAFLVLVDASAGPVTITLLRADGWGGKKFCIKKVDSSVNAVTVVPIAGQTIDGLASVTLSSQNDSLDIISNNEDYDVIAVANAGAGGFSSILLAELVANQAGVGVGDDVVWDSEVIKIGNAISLNIATGEFTLQPGTYELQANFRGLTFSNAAGGFLSIGWVDGANADINKSAALLAPVSGTGPNSANSVASTIIIVIVPTIVKTRVINNTGNAIIVAATSRVIIKKLR